MVTTTATLQIKTLGRLQISCGDQPVTGLKSRKAIALLVYLAYTAKVHPRTMLAEMFSNDRPEDITRATLRRLLCHLRRVIGPYLATTNDTAAMNPDADYSLDIVEVEKTLRICTADGIITSYTGERIAKLERAVALYQGDFLDGFFVNCADFENWLTFHRDKLRFMVTYALDQLVDHYILEGDYRTAMEHARRLLTIDELREETYRQLMILSAISGHRVEAFRFYNRFCQLLDTEFPDAKPAPETDNLINRIRAGTFKPPDSNLNIGNLN
jgi:DNA-binding SARP family transcriptional activator